jgi:hypothetical protein
MDESMEGVCAKKKKKRSEMRVELKGLVIVNDGKL